MGFKKATKAQAKLRLALEGPAGSGKTYTALQVATLLGGRIAVLDSEHGSASKYAGQFQFDTDDEFDDFSIETYIKKIKAAGAAGYDVLVVDSLSHAWAGKGGALEQVDRLGGKSKFTNGWSQVTPLQTRMIEEILAYPGHVIVTMRTKTEYVLEEKNGKQVPKKMGMAPIQRDGVDYELDVVALFDLEENISITKTRCPDLKGSAGLMKYEDVPRMVAKLKAWLSDGTPAPSLPRGNGQGDGERVAFGPHKGMAILHLTSSMLDDCIQLATEKLNAPEARGAKWADALQMNLAALQAEQASRQVAESPRDSTELAPGNP